MLNEAEAIFEEVQSRADLENGLVVAAAFKASSVVCPNCHFPENALRFFQFLNLYVYNKMSMRRIHRSSQRLWGRPYADDYSEVEYEKRANHYRRELHLIMPCVDCRKKYNPTKRLRHLCGQVKFPETKGLLE